MDVEIVYIFSRLVTRGNRKMQIYRVYILADECIMSVGKTTHTPFLAPPMYIYMRISVSFSVLLCLYVRLFDSVRVCMRR